MVNMKNINAFLWIAFLSMLGILASIFSHCARYPRSIIRETWIEDGKALSISEVEEDDVILRVFSHIPKLIKGVNNNTRYFIKDKTEINYSDIFVAPTQRNIISPAPFASYFDRNGINRVISGEIINKIDTLYGNNIQMFSSDTLDSIRSKVDFFSIYFFRDKYPNTLLLCVSRPGFNINKDRTLITASIRGFLHSTRYAFVLEKSGDQWSILKVIGLSKRLH